jgi:hypothetical protein
LIVLEILYKSFRVSSVFRKYDDNNDIISQNRRRRISCGGRVASVGRVLVFLLMAERASIRQAEVRAMEGRHPNNALPQRSTYLMPAQKAEDTTLNFNKL